MSAKSTDETVEYYERLAKERYAREDQKRTQFIEENIYKRAEGFVKEHPYIDSFLNSAQGYEVLTRFMVEFSKSERKL